MEGGVGAFTQELAKSLHTLGHDVHILTHRAARPPSNDRDWRTLREPIKQDYAQIYPFIAKWRWRCLDEAASWALRYEFDVVNVQYQAAAYHMRSPAANFFPWRLKGITNTVVTFHDLRVPYLFPKAGCLRQKAITFMARQSHAIITTNSADHSQLKIHNPQFTIKEIPIGSNITVHTPKAAALAHTRQQLGLNDDDILLGYFGFLNESKGADTLILALSQLDSRHHLVFIGGRMGASDPNNNQQFYQKLDAQIADLGLTNRVHWTGFVDDAIVSTYLQTADLMVIPYRDGASLRRGTLMAVLAHKRPLITTQPTHLTPELVHGENTWIIPPDDASALVAAIQELLSSNDICTQLSQGAGQLADRFTWGKIAAQTAQFFAEVVA